MSAAPTRHAEQARRVAGFVHQTMRERGLACQRHELEVALLELTPMQLGQVHSSAGALSKGADGREDMALLAALRAVSAQSARDALSAAGVIYRADVLLPLASAAGTGPSFSRELSRLRRADLPESERDQAAVQLRQMCGRLDHADLLHEPGPPARGPQPTAAPDSFARPDQPPAAPPTLAATAPARAIRRQVKVYGRTAALTWEAAPVRTAPSGEQEGTVWTIMVEGAKALGDGSFDWRTKIIFACAQRELPQVLAVLLGWHQMAEFRFHGGKAGKDLSLAHQEHGLFVKLRDNGQTVAVPVADADRYALAMLVLGVMADNDPGRDRQSVLAVCRDVMNPASFTRDGPER